MESLILVLHVLLAICVITLVLLQHGRGADAGAAFGSGASSTVFGARGAASFLSKMTTTFATLFFVTSLGLAMLAAQRPAVTSVTDQVTPTEEPTASDAAESDLPVNRQEQTEQQDVPEIE